MASFDFSLDNGLPLILTAGGTTATGHVFVAGRDDCVFSISGTYSMDIDNSNNVTINLSDMRAYIFPNWANYSRWFYYATAWANARGNCVNIWMDAATSRQGHGGWSDGNSAWKYAAGWKGGVGAGWVKYRYGTIEDNCAGSSGDGIYHGAGRAPGNMSFSLGQVDFASTTGFWLGANLDCWDGGYEVWQWLEFPIIIFEPPSISAVIDDVDICDKTAYVDISMTSYSTFASGGGTWELQYSTASDFSNAITLTKYTNNSTVLFDDVALAADTYYYVRGRIKVSSIRYSRWAETSISTAGYIPDADAMASDISETECYNLKHGALVEGGVDGL